MGLIIWTDWNGDKYAFCSRLCLDVYRRYLGDPTIRHLLPVILPTFSCWWCGKDLTDGASRWLTDCGDPGIVKLEEGRDEDRTGEPA